MFQNIYLSSNIYLFKIKIWVGGVVSHVILVPALGQNPSFFDFSETFIQLGGLLGQGLGLGPGLDNFSYDMLTLI